MKRLVFLFSALFALISHAGAELPDPSEETAGTAGSVLEKSGKIESLKTIPTYKTVYLDYIASELKGEVAPVSSDDTYLIHHLYVTVNGVNYYPEEETLEEKVKDDLPSFRAFVNPRENPDEIVGRNGKTKSFRILLPDHPRQKNGKYIYRIEYHAVTSNGGICNYTFTERRTLADAL